MSILTVEPSEEEFIWEWEGKKYPSIMAKPKEICECDWNLFADIKEDNFGNNIYNKKIFDDTIDLSGDYFLKQTNCGNCFLISSIISLINIPGILQELFYFKNKNNQNFTHNDEYIYLYCYLKGIRRIIKIKNTYPIYKNENDKIKYLKEFCTPKSRSNTLSNIYSNCSPIIFATSKNGILLCQALIKAFVCTAYIDPDQITIFSLENFISSFQNIFNLPIINMKGLNNFVNDAIEFNIFDLYKKLNEGYLPEYVMNTFLGCISEFIYKEGNKILNEDDNINMIKKIIKYFKLGGFIEVGTETPSHSYSLQNYLELEEEDKVHYYFIILDPNRGEKNFEEQGLKEYDDIILGTNNPTLKEGCNVESIINKSIIKSINEKHDLTGLMVLKDNIFFKWFNTLTFSESMFGTKNILIKIKENEKIEIKVKEISKICINITFFPDSEEKEKINLPDLNKYIEIKFLKINNNNFNEEINFSDKKFINKIYEELNIGYYQLSFKVIKRQIDFFCQIKYYEEKIEINSNNIVNYEIYFPLTRKINCIFSTIIQNFIPPDKDNSYFLHQDPRKNNNIIINYDDNYTLYWIEPPKKFNINEYKYFTSNYKTKIITKVYHLLYFVPIFIIIYYIEKKIFEIRAPENESMTIDENYKILSVSEKLKKHAGKTLFDYKLNAKKFLLNNANNKDKVDNNIKINNNKNSNNNIKESLISIKNDNNNMICKYCPTSSNNNISSSFPSSPLPNNNNPPPYNYNNNPSPNNPNNNNHYPIPNHNYTPQTFRNNYPYNNISPNNNNNFSNNSNYNLHSTYNNYPPPPYNNNYPPSSYNNNYSTPSYNNNYPPPYYNNNYPPPPYNNNYSPQYYNNNYPSPSYNNKYPY